MAKEIKKIDLIPDWVRSITSAQKEPPVDHKFRVVDPFAPGSEGTVRAIKAELYKDPDGSGVVQLVWEGTTPPVQEFYKKYASSKEAEMVFSSLLKELRQIESFVDTDPARAKEKVGQLFDEYKGKSDARSVDPSVGTRTNTSLHQEILKGWNILNKEGKLLVSFSDEFLGRLFGQFKKAASEPVTTGEFVYTTTSRPHCGLDNFVVSYWRKAQTADGNIVRNAALVSRIGGSSYFVTSVSQDDLNRICSALTPDPLRYGIAYDSVTGKWYKTAARVEENLGGLSDKIVVERIQGTPEQIAEYDRLKSKKGKDAAEVGVLKSEDKKDKAEDKSKDKQSPEKELEDLLKEPPAEQVSELSDGPDADAVADALDGLLEKKATVKKK